MSRKFYLQAAKILPALGLSLALLAISPFQALAEKGNPDAVPGEPSQPIYEIIIDYDVPITLRDGVVVTADIHRPNAPGQFPTLVEGTPYGKQSSTDMVFDAHLFYPPRGFVFIAWDSRGRGNSGGDFVTHVNEINDSYDVAEWISQQPWSDGQIGLVGNSYGGQTVLSGAVSQHPAIKCGMAMHTAADLWRQWYYRGGAMEWGFVSDWLVVCFNEVDARKYLRGQQLEDWLDEYYVYMADMESYATVLPLTDFAPPKIPGAYPPLDDRVLEWTSHPTDGPYYWARNMETYFHEIAIPMTHIGGWYDIFQDGTLQAYRDISEHGANELARDNQRLFIGPWGHEGTRVSQIGEIDYGADVVNLADFNQVRLSFFDYWLKDIAHGVMSNIENDVYYFTMGDNQWNSMSTWPSPEIQYTNYYFNTAKSGSAQSLYDGTLSTSAPTAADASITYAYDPMKPVPTRGGSSLQGFSYGEEGLMNLLAIGAVDQSPIEKYVLTFTTDVLTQDMEITGDILAHLFASSDAVDTDFVVRLCDVYPDGKSYNIQEGIQRARFRQSGIHPTLIEPGQIYEYEVDLWSTSHVFKAGHRIRVQVTSSSFPRWSRNLNVAEFPEWGDEWVVANNTIYVDAEHPSNITLPVIPR